MKLLAELSLPRGPELLRQRINMFLATLQEGLARKIAYDNAMRLYKLKD